MPMPGSGVSSGKAGVVVLLPGPPARSPWGGVPREPRVGPASGLQSMGQLCRPLWLPSESGPEDHHGGDRRLLRCQAWTQTTPTMRPPTRKASALSPTWPTWWATRISLMHFSRYRCPDRGEKGQVGAGGRRRRARGWRRPEQLRRPPSVQAYVSKFKFQSILADDLLDFYLEYFPELKQRRVDSIPGEQRGGPTGWKGCWGSWPPRP